METSVFLSDIEKNKKSIGIIHRVYLTQVKNARVFTAFTKTKSEVRGGGRKPWRQKGTGNARAGSIRSPLFVGGGVIFGPKPRVCSKKINKKERRLAILYAFYLKKKQWTFIEDRLFLELKIFKTKSILDIIKTSGVNSSEKILILLPHEVQDLDFPKPSNDSSGNSAGLAKDVENLKDLKSVYPTIDHKKLFLAARNLKNITITKPNCLNLGQLLNSNHILLSPSSLKTINFTYGNKSEKA